MLREAGAEEACVLITDSWAEIAEYIRRGERRVVVTRETRETRITVRLDLDGRGFGTCGTAENEMAENGTTENGTEGRPENTAGSKNGTSDDAAYGTCGAVRNGGKETGAGTLPETSENGLSSSPGNGTPGNRADSPGTPGTDIPPYSPAGCGGAPGDGISTGLRFLDHMLAQIAHHGGVSLTVEAHGDLDIDEHHTMEDVAIVLGEAIDRALGSKAGIGRYGFALPMDDCRALVLLDFGGRIDFEWDAEFRRERVGDVPTEMFRHFFHSLCCAARCNLQIAAKGDNDHHKAEAIFKAFARALRMAVARTGFGYDIPSSKGIL